MRPITMQEVEMEAKSLQAGKSPGPDGFTTYLFHACWDTIKEEVHAIMEKSQQTKGILSAFNVAFLTLIPKGHCPSTLNKFRPIALCNVIYKIITKLIATRVKPLLPLLVSKEQTGYVEGRQILDGIILAHEVVHSLKLTKKPGMLMKLHMSKAFKRLNSSYIVRVL